MAVREYHHYYSSQSLKVQNPEVRYSSGKVHIDGAEHLCWHDAGLNHGMALGTAACMAQIS
eukprot:9709024-Ditylum_brightwellii.AAC.1